MLVKYGWLILKLSVVEEIRLAITKIFGCLGNEEDREKEKVKEEKEEEEEDDEVGDGRRV